MEMMVQFAQGLDALDASKMGVIGLQAIIIAALWKLWREEVNKNNDLITQRDAEQKALIATLTGSNPADSKH